jgi:CoA-transferase family III
MGLTGRADGPPLVAPDGVVAAIEALGAGLEVDPLRLLGERAAIAGLSRRGSTSCGGGARLLRAGDGLLVAVSLTRADDTALLPAFLGVDAPASGEMLDGTWEAVAAAVATCPAGEVVDRASPLGLAVSRAGEVTATGIVTTTFGAVPQLDRAPVVVDLSSLWAGPLATRLLRRCGARVIKVESTGRPDGARRGPPAFFDLMHAGKEAVAFDLQRGDGAGELQALLAAADVVVEASRPRALEQLGIDAGAVVAHGPRVWLSITGYGRDEPVRNRAAFGDDGAVAGGLVADGREGACFVADAVADPLTGVVAAAAVLDALSSGTRTLLDVALSRVAARIARAADGEPWRAGHAGMALPPVAPSPRGRAPRLGEHTEQVRREFLR